MQIIKRHSVWYGPQVALKGLMASMKLQFRFEPCGKDASSRTDGLFWFLDYYSEFYTILFKKIISDN
jgi:hypothetical protein